MDFFKRLLSPKKTDEPARNYHLQGQEIPKGFQIYEERLDVMGIVQHKKAALAFAENYDGGWLELEREETNSYDKNAIKVIGCHPASRYFIGYVPKEISKLIVEGNFFDQVKPRLLKTYVGGNDFVEVSFQILGPYGKKYEFRQTEKTKGKHYTDYVDRVEQLIQDKKHPEVIELLLKLINQIEAESKRKKIGVAPWYYQQLAMVYRKEKRLKDEVEILERFMKQQRPPGSAAQHLEKRLTEAKQLMDKFPTSESK